MRPRDETSSDAPGRVVVAVDGSPSSIRALRHGARIAEALALGITVVTAWRQSAVNGGAPGGLLDPHGAAVAAEVAADQAEAVAVVFGSAPPADLRRRVVEGATIPTLLAESVGAEMLVLGSRGRGGFTGLLLGSVGAACAAHAGCAVLVCRPDSEVRSVPAPRGAGIVVGVDGTRASVGALRQGARFAQSLHLPLLAICASGDATSPGLDPTAALATATKHVFGSTPPDWFRSDVREGAPAAVLGRASEHARMLVIGHSSTRTPTTARESVSSSIAVEAACPVVIFHATPPSEARSFDGRTG